MTFACAVCFGNPHSALSQGVVAGVLLLMGVIGSMLAGIACVAFTWSRRARNSGGQTPDVQNSG